MSKIDHTIKLSAILAFMGTGILGVTALQVHDANAQGKPAKAGKAAVEKVRAATKAELKRGLTVDLPALEAYARATHETLQGALQQVRDTELALAAAVTGSPEADAASEAWLKAQGVAMLAQQDFNLAMRSFEEAKTLKATVATAFVEERCEKDDGKDGDVARVCGALAAAKAEAAAKGAAAAEAASKVPGAR